MNNKSLLEVIRENLKDGELLDSFSLPKEDDGDTNKVKWADGALDGVMIFHMRRSEISDEQMDIVSDAFSMLDDNEKVMTRMKDFFAKVSPLSGIDAIQSYILRNTQTLDANQVYSLANDCIFSSDVNMVKLGLLIVEIFNEPDDQLKDVIRTLGSSDEFTIFSVFNMMSWENGNQEVFELAKRVHGWGRIHAVERLEPETEEIKEWLLAEGINNTVISDYSALVVYEKVNIAEILKNSVTDAQLEQISRVLISMFSEGPVGGISVLPENDAIDMIGDYISQAETHLLTGDTRNLLGTISEDKRFEMYAEKCKEILERNCEK